MINFQIYKNGQQIAFEKQNNYFSNNKYQTLFIFHGLYGRGKNWQTFSKKLSKYHQQLGFTLTSGGNKHHDLLLQPPADLVTP